MMLNEKTKTEQEIKDNIQKRVLRLERYNLIQKEFSAQVMEDKIRKIIEEEVGK